MEKAKVILNNRNFIADIKRKAAETYPKQEKINKNNATIARLTEENEDLQAEIDGANISIRRKTATEAKPEGYTALELCHRVVDNTGKQDKNGFDIKKTSYVLNWPETIIPVEVATAVDNTNDPINVGASSVEEEEAAAQDAVEAQAEFREEAEEDYNNAMAEEAE